MRLQRRQERSWSRSARWIARAGCARSRRSGARTLSVAIAALATLLAGLTAHAGGPCGDPSSGSCLDGTGTPGCTDVACCEWACAQDAYCCDVEWDVFCAKLAQQGCLDCGAAGTNFCVVTSGLPACNDATCCEETCTIDAFCCETAWDETCVLIAQIICAGCGDPKAGDCTTPNPTPGCADLECCTVVCTLDPFCCAGTWDEVCVTQAIGTCTSCGGAGTGTCFLPRTMPGCSDADCCASTCDVDPFCCSVLWDGPCVVVAMELCAGCGDPNNGPCFAESKTPGCRDFNCCGTVCLQDPYCCDSAWDETCAGRALALCVGCGSPGGGFCTIPHDSVGCLDGECCGAVCEVDPVCCNVNWDEICVVTAQVICLGCPLDPLGDIDGDGAVNGADLAMLLASWGLDGCGDYSGDGVIDGIDLTVLLSNWSG